MSNQSIFNFCMFVWCAGWAAFDLSRANGPDATFMTVCGGVSLACCAFFFVLLVRDLDS